MRFLLLVLLSVAGLTSSASAQPPAAQAERLIAGIIRDAKTGVPLPGVTVSAGDRRTVTDVEGRFTLRVAAGLVSIEVSAEGFYPLTTPIDVTLSDATETELLLVPRTGFASTVDVVAAPPPTTSPSAVVVTPAEVLRTPGALDNVFRTLQTLPGVAAAEEFSSRLAVRGGAPDQNLTVMDGVEIHDPYRLFGLTSAFNPETISRFELATGGFSVKYGDRLSSLLVIENREGTRRERFNGSGSLSITDANVVLEGGLPGGANGSWLFSGRRTYYDLVASRVADQEFPRFADLQAKAVWELAPGRLLSVFGLRSRQDAALDIDSDDARGEFNDNTNNDLISVRLDATGGGTARSHTIVAYSNSASTFGVNGAFENRSQRANTAEENFDVATVVFDRDLSLRDVSVRQEVDWTLGAHVVEAGGEWHRLGTGLSFVILGDRNPAAANGSSQQGGAGLPDSLQSVRDVSRGGLWLLDRWQAAPALALEAGIRLDRSGINGDTRLSPRMTGTWSLDSRTRLRGAAGRYTQSPGYEKLVQSDYVLDLTGDQVDRLRSEQAVQVSGGLERDIAAGTSVRIEGYYKASSHLLIGRLETDSERQDRLAQYDFPPDLASNVPVDPIITSTPTNDGSGRAYGFDLFVSRTAAPASARVRGWASYTWGRAERESYGRVYPFEYDRRHAFAAVGSYRLSNRWEVSATTRLATGFPRTPPLGVRIASEADLMDRDGDGNREERVPALDAAAQTIYAVDFGGVDNLNTARLPMFARVDLRITWRPRGAQSGWELFGEIINLLNRQNAGALEAVLEYDPASDRPKIVEQRDQGIPRIPTVGFRFRF